MCRLLRADFYRMYRKKWFWLCVLFMIALAAAFVMLQYTAMEYTVGLDRVIFLPLSFFGVASGALLSLFAGEDFSDGVIRNKMIAGAKRSSIYLSNLSVSIVASLTVYLFTIAVTIGVGVWLFVWNVSVWEIMFYLILGLFCCAAYACIYAMCAMLLAKKSTAVVVCMGLSFFLLFLALHTNQMMIQLLGTGEAMELWYGILHDFNPCGQAAQLSQMKCLNAVRFVAADIGWIVASVCIGTWLFGKKDIK